MALTSYEAVTQAMDGAGGPRRRLPTRAPVWQCRTLSPDNHLHGRDDMSEAHAVHHHPPALNGSLCRPPPLHHETPVRPRPSSHSAPPNSFQRVSSEANASAAFLIRNTHCTSPLSWVQQTRRAAHPAPGASSSRGRWHQRRAAATGASGPRQPPATDATQRRGHPAGTAGGQDGRWARPMHRCSRVSVT